MRGNAMTTWSEMTESPKPSGLRSLLRRLFYPKSKRIYTLMEVTPRGRIQIGKSTEMTEPNFLLLSAPES
jgi:hypothetical protein